MLIDQFADGIGDVARFVDVVEAGIDPNPLATAAVGPQLLAHAPAVVADQGVGSLQDGAGGAVVLLQTHHPGIGEFLGETLDVLDPCATPAVDGLVIIADHGHAFAITGQQLQPGVLQGVGILELVDQQVGEALAVMRQQVRRVTQQLQRAQQQLTEIHQPATLAGQLIELVHLDHLAHVGVAVGLDLMGPQPLFLAAGDEVLDLLGRPALVIDVVLLEQSLDHAQLVIAVDDLEVLGQTRLLPVGAQQTVTDGVEGADPHVAQTAAIERLETRAHLAGGLVGEGHRQDGIGRELVSVHQPGDAMDQHAGLAGAGARQYQHVARRRGHGLTLMRVEVIEEGRFGHAGLTTGQRSRGAGQRVGGCPCSGIHLITAACPALPCTRHP